MFFKVFEMGEIKAYLYTIGKIKKRDLMVWEEGKLFGVLSLSKPKGIRPGAHVTVVVLLGVQTRAGVQEVGTGVRGQGAAESLLELSFLNKAKRRFFR